MATIFDKADAEFEAKMHEPQLVVKDDEYNHLTSEENQYLKRIEENPEEMRTEKLTIERSFYLGQTVWQGVSGLKNLQGSYVPPIEMVLSCLMFQGFAHRIDETGAGIFTAVNSATGNEEEVQDWGGLDVSIVLALANQLCFQPHVFQADARVKFIPQSFNRNGHKTAAEVSTADKEARRSRPDLPKDSPIFTMMLHPFWTCMAPGIIEGKPRHKDFDDIIGRLCFCGWPHLLAEGLNADLQVSERKQWCFAAGFYGDMALVNTVVHQFAIDTVDEPGAPGPEATGILTPPLGESRTIAAQRCAALLMESALRGAAAGGQLDLGRFLIHHRKVSPLALDDVKRPAFAFAVRAGQSDFAFLLLKHGADAKYVTSKGRTALHLAAKNGHRMLVTKLLDAGIEVNIQDNYMTRPIHEAVMHDHLGCVKVLVERGANITAQDSRGAEVIHVASFKGLADVVEFLLEVSDGEEAMVKTAKHECLRHELSPLHYALMGTRNVKVIALLLDHGASPYQKDRQGRTCLRMAETFEKEEKDPTKKHSIKQAILAMQTWKKKDNAGLGGGKVTTAARAGTGGKKSSGTVAGGLQVGDHEDIM